MRKLLIKLIYVESFVFKKYISIILRNCNWIIIQKKYHYIWFNIWEIQKKKKNKLFIFYKHNKFSYSNMKSYVNFITINFHIRIQQIRKYKKLDFFLIHTKSQRNMKTDIIKIMYLIIIYTIVYVQKYIYQVI